jgi:hypothetical protein
MRENCTYGSARGAPGNLRSYRNTAGKCLQGRNADTVATATRKKFPHLKKESANGIANPYRTGIVTQKAPIKTTLQLP